MIYYNENNDYIMSECEVCKREIYTERSSVAEEDAYSYHLANPLKCVCGNIDEYINKAKKSCYNIRQELSALSDLLHRQHSINSRINGITAEINKKFNPPTFWQSLIRNLLFSGKIFLYMLGGLLGLQIFLFIITLIMFFCGLAFSMPDLSRSGNQLFYNLNVFKDRGGAFLSRFGMPAELPEFDLELASEQIILDYIPYAIAGSIMIIFYIFLLILAVKVGVDLYKLVFFASKVMNQKIKVTRRHEAYERELNDLRHELSSLEARAEELDILGPDYKTIKATDSILKYFTNNRVDTIREAINLYHEDDFKNKQLEYSRALYAEAKHTRRYTKAMYMLTSDSNIKVEVRDEPEPAPAAATSQPSSDSSKSKPPSLKSGAAKPPERANKTAADKPGETAAKAERDDGEAAPVKSADKTETFSTIFESDDSEETKKKAQE